MHPGDTLDIVSGLQSPKHARLLDLGGFVHLPSVLQHPSLDELLPSSAHT